METLLERLENISHLELEELDVSGHYTRSEKAWQCHITDNHVVYAKQRFKKFYYKSSFPDSKVLYMNIVCLEEGEYVIYEFADFYPGGKTMTMVRNTDIHCILFPVVSGWLEDIKIEKKVITLRICMKNQSYSETMRIVSHNKSIHELYKILVNMEHRDKIVFEGYEFEKSVETIFYKRM